MQPCGGRRDTLAQCGDTIIADYTGVRLHRLPALTIAGVLLLGPVAYMRGVAQVGGQLGFQHPLDHPLRQLFQQAMLPEDVLRAGIVFKQFI